jgi:hypothetical protein
MDPPALTGVHLYRPQVKAQTWLRLNPCCAVPTWTPQYPAGNHPFTSLDITYFIIHVTTKYHFPYHISISVKWTFLNHSTVTWVFWADIQSVLVVSMCWSVWRNVGLFCSTNFLVPPGMMLQMLNNYLWVKTNVWAVSYYFFIVQKELNITRKTMSISLLTCLFHNKPKCRKAISGP